MFLKQYHFYKCKAKNEVSSREPRIFVSSESGGDCTIEQKLKSGEISLRGQRI